MTRRQIVEILGWCGALMLLAAYGLSSADVLSKGQFYQSLNLFGAAGVGVSALSRRSYPAAFLEFAWAAIALWALLFV